MLTELNTIIEDGGPPRLRRHIQVTFEGHGAHISKGVMGVLGVFSLLTTEMTFKSSHWYFYFNN